MTKTLPIISEHMNATANVSSDQRRRSYAVLLPIERIRDLMVNALLRVRSEVSASLFKTFTHLKPFQFIFVTSITYNEEDNSKFKHAFILVDHATKAMYKIDSKDNDAKSNATAFTQIVQQTHMYSLDYHITVETNKDTKMEGMHQLKQTVNLNIIEHNRENPGALERCVKQVIRASRIFNHAFRVTVL